MTGESTVGRWLATKISAGVPSWTVVALWVAMNCGTLAAAQKNVLILTSEDAFRPIALVLIQNIRKALVDGSTNHLDFYTETLDQARFPEAQYGARRLDYFRWKYAGRPPDIIFAAPTAAVDFLIAHRDELFPGVPVVFFNSHESRVRERKLPADYTGLPIRFDVGATVKLALQLQPDTREVVVVFGKAPFDKVWEEMARPAFRPFESKVHFRYLNDLPLAAMLEELSRLPAHTIVFCLTVSQDAAGANWDPIQVYRKIAERANAPFYTLYEHAIGLGAVGGYVCNVQRDAEHVAALGLRILGGEKASSIPIQPAAPSYYTVDWRAMQRWGLLENRLPPDTDVRFRVPTFWEQYKWRIIALLAVCLAEAFLIVLLVLSRRRRQRAQSALKESEERMTMATEATNMGVWMYDLVKSEIWATEKWRSLFGFAKSDPLNFNDFVNRLHADDREAVRQTFARAIERGGHYETEFRVACPDSQIRWIASRGRVEFNRGGKPVCLRGVSLDITQNKQANHQIAQQRDELAHLSRVTTVSELSGSLAHELNQPLAIILTNAQAAQRLLAQSPPDIAEAQEILTDIVSEDQRAGQVIRRLRSLLKHGETSQQPLSVNEIIDDVLRLARTDLIGRGVTVHRALAADVPQALGDRIHLQQVLLNLILNACDAMAANPPAIQQLTIATAHRNGAVRVSVSDTGCGLPLDTERVFEPFYTTKKHGLGLGLSICRSIITAHQGRLWAESTAARGAVFHLELRPVGEASDQ